MSHLVKQMSDEKILCQMPRLAKLERRVTVRVLEFLAEVDLRRLWIKEGYSSLFDYCVRGLGYSEGEANRRIQAARCATRVEEVKPLLAANALSLSGLSLVAPYITAQNAKEILPAIEGRPVREIEKVLHEKFPESRPVEEFLRIPLDDELKSLLKEAGVIASEKVPGLLLKKVLKKFVAVKPRRNWPEKHTRYIPAALRRAVREEEKRCAFRSAGGVQCNQTAHLQFDHVRPWAKGGSSWDRGNLRLLCRAHNQLLAMAHFPRAVSRARGS